MIASKASCVPYESQHLSETDSHEAAKQHGDAIGNESLCSGFPFQVIIKSKQSGFCPLALQQNDSSTATSSAAFQTVACGGLREATYVNPEEIKGALRIVLVFHSLSRFRYKRFSRQSFPYALHTKGRN